MFEHGSTAQAGTGEDGACLGEDEDVLTPLGPASSGPAPDLTALQTFRESLAASVDGLDDAARIDQIRALEELKAAAAARQARLSVEFDASQREEQATAGVPRKRLGRGVGEQISAARRDAPRKGGQHLGLAHALIRVLPHTMRGLELGRITERRASLILREIACLSEQDQREIDRRLAADTDAVEGWGDRRFSGEAHKHALELDNAALAERRRRAVGGRRVTVRPAPDGMGYLTGLLPLAQGVAVYATLFKHATSLIATGDERTPGQIMADTLIERVTGAPAAAPVPVEIRLVVTDRTLLAGGNEPAYLPGYGSIPAEAARDMVRDAIRYQTHTGTAAGASQRAGPPAARGSRSPDEQNQREQKKAYAWLRAVYTHPSTGALIAMSSKRRTAPAGLADLIDTRDQTCRTPWCDAPIRHHDHITPAAAGGPTHGEQMQGLCEACNYTKETYGWNARRVPGPRHTVTTTTPTGHRYTSRAPRLPGAPPEPALADYSYVENQLIEVLIAA
ncbi:uncharacterized protein DUF222 [Antricoccus suffuscus]|uniref:Uncharacterized protein DUF222 n=1 Tax=Antricoccus suffuscus TaxID=1629062 RepID=A0A2T1A4J9_9ACTN|nr:HNH endonuclease signature motif containing protein [Antricoccus suffuscus]PRZ43474.1 uncharacterized protein DUF222 [Antricoccus suffuscus]